MNVIFGASTWLWTSPFHSKQSDLLRRIARLGFDAVELPIEDPALVSPGELLPVLRETGLKPYLCGAFGPGRDLTSDDAGIRRDTRAYLSRLMDLAEAIGAPFIAGPMYAQVGKARQLPPDERRREWDLAVNELTAVAREAGQRGLQLAIEAINRFESDLVNRTADSVRLAREIDHPAARVMVDSFHMTIEEANLGDAIREAGDLLVHVQVSENHRGVTGTGLTPWNDFHQALRDIRYSGAVVIESFTPDNRDLAGAVCIWNRFTATQDEFASRGLRFLHELFQHQPAAASV